MTGVLQLTKEALKVSLEYKSKTDEEDCSNKLN